MEYYKVVLSKLAKKDAENLKAAKLSEDVKQLCAILAINPFQLPYKKLNGNLEGKYSRRINIKHRLIYEIYEDIKTIKVLRMWGHYE